MIFFQKRDMKNRMDVVMCRKIQAKGNRVDPSDNLEGTQLPVVQFVARTGCLDVLSE